MDRALLVLATSILLAACGSSGAEPETPRGEPAADQPAADQPGADQPGAASQPGATGQPAPQGRPCGMSPDDWCAAPPGDPCGAHAGADACRADDRCEGMPYRGESLVACALDARCFATNCPVVGCISRCETLDQAACTLAADRCAWSGRCARREPCAP